MLFHFFFTLSLYAYFAFYQSLSLSYLVSAAWGEPVYAAMWLWAFLPTAFFSWASYKMRRLLEMRGREGYAGYVAASFAAASLCSLPWAASRHYVAIIFAAALLVLAYEGYNRRNPEMRERFLPHCVSMAALLVYMGLGAASTDMQLYERSTACRILDGEPERALKIAEKAEHATPRLFALRVVAMSRTKGGTGNQLFSHPVPRGGAELLLLPADRCQQLTFPNEELYRQLGDAPRAGEAAMDYFERCAKRNPKNDVAVDYYLSALLVERKLDRFAQAVATYKRYDLHTHRLGHYYAEALLLYQRMRTAPKVVYIDRNITANYLDFCAMRDTIPHPVERRNLLRRSYGETYWWYYNYGER